jgi:hypothetical protein
MLRDIPLIRRLYSLLIAGKQEVSMIRFLILMLGLVPLLSGCSYMTLFAVVNKSDQPIVMNYVISESSPGNPPCPDDRHILIPRTSDAGPQKNIRAHDLPIAQYTCDPSTRTVKVTLLPTKTGYLLSRINFTEQELHQQTGVTFPISTLTINKNENEKFPVNQVGYTFKKVNDMLYVITYR